jgi:hypothetical protein
MMTGESRGEAESRAEGRSLEQKTRAEAGRRS